MSVHNVADGKDEDVLVTQTEEGISFPDIVENEEMENVLEMQAGKLISFPDVVDSEEKEDVLEIQTGKGRIARVIVPILSAPCVSV